MTKFDVPDEYARPAFSKETMPEAATPMKTDLYLALENRCKILLRSGSAKNSQQRNEPNYWSFPKNTEKRIRTQLLIRALEDQKKGRKQEQSS